MEFSTVFLDVQEKDVRPMDEYNGYLDRLKQDIPNYYAEKGESRMTCPVCNASLSNMHPPGEEFTKNLITYVKCGSCSSVVAKEKFVLSNIQAFFTESESRKYWMTEIWSKTSEARIEKIYQPFVSWAQGRLLDYDFAEALSVAEFLPNQPGLLEGWKRVRSKDNLSAFASCVTTGTNLGESVTIHSIETNEKVDILMSVDGLNRFEDPARALSWAIEHLNPGGLFFFTTTLSTGIETLELGADSYNVLPPDRLFLPSYEGLQALAARAGFEVVEFSTPGMLDAALLRHAEKEGRKLSPTIQYFLNNRSVENDVKEFQSTLQKLRLSAFGRVLLHKKDCKKT